VIFWYLRHLDPGDCRSNRGDSHSEPLDRVARCMDHVDNAKVLRPKGWGHAHGLKYFGIGMTFFGALAEKSEFEVSESGIGVACD